MINKLKFCFNPPKVGNVYYSDPIYFVISKPIEHVLHALTNKYGNKIYHPVSSNFCYRLTVESDSLPSYYICKSEVFCKGVDDNGIVDFNNIGIWKERSQPKRIKKDFFKEMVLNGILVKGDIF